MCRKGPKDMFSRQTHPGDGTAARRSARRIDLIATAGCTGLRQADSVCDRCSPSCSATDDISTALMEAEMR